LDFLLQSIRVLIFELAGVVAVLLFPVRFGGSRGRFFAVEALHGFHFLVVVIALSAHPLTKPSVPTFFATEVMFYFPYSEVVHQKRLSALRARYQFSKELAYPL
jgi:hypothetical protein